MAQNDAIEKAEADFAQAQKKVHRSPTFNEGGAGAEVAYAAAYDGLVKAGVAQPLRGKYRPR